MIYTDDNEYDNGDDNIDDNDDAMTTKMLIMIMVNDIY